MRENDLFPGTGSQKDRKRVGRGDSSGHGSFSGRGCKGHKARAGFTTKRGFEGGQMPLTKRLPQKRGFFNVFGTEYSVVNLTALGQFESGSEVTPEKLVASGVVKSLRQPVKILGDGEVNYPLVVRAHKFSASARAKIEAAGGKAEEMTYAFPAH
ncbi:MAG: 50S ribosomal protein L15 [Chloroflexi bacterium]|nr:50S ribosomal protein L15 [Chloroflexota bacterium]